MHLAVEEEAKLYGHKDARKSRYYTGLLASEMLTLSSFKFEQYLERFLFVNIPSYYYLDFRLDLSQKITFHPNGFPATALAAENNTKARVGINELVFVRPGVATLEFHSTGRTEIRRWSDSANCSNWKFCCDGPPWKDCFLSIGKDKDPANRRLKHWLQCDSNT